MTRNNRVDCTWRPELAYAIGLITSDGNLSPDGRHICLTSKDREQVETFKTILNVQGKIGTKARGKEKEKKYFICQFSDVHFYRFLLTIGLKPAKSKTLNVLLIPDNYFADFLRGCIDGDGNIGTYNHPESKQYQIKLSVCSASMSFLLWVKDKIRHLYPISGGSFYSYPNKSISTLAYGKRDSLLLFQIMYYANSVPALERKRLKAYTLSIECRSGEIGQTRLP